MSYLRSIMLAVRGSYQAGMAMRMARTDIQKLVKEQKDQIRATEEMIQKSHQILFAGAAFTVFGGLVTKGLMKVMEYSQEGRRALFQFSRSTTQSLRRISKAIAPMLKSFLDLAAGIMEFISKSPLLSKIAAGFLILAGPLLLIGGLLTVVYGSARMVVGMLDLKRQMANMAAQSMIKLTSTTQGYGTMLVNVIPPTQALTFSMRSLLTTIGSVAVYLSVAYLAAKAVSDAFGPLAGIIVGLIAVFAPLVALLWSGATAMAVLTGGVAVLGAIATIGMLSKSIPSYQAGTSFVKKGGLAVLHGGEEVKSARESRFVSKIEKTTIQSAPSGPQNVGYYNIPITVDQLNTKADIDDVGRVIKRALKEALDNKI